MLSCGRTDGEITVLSLTVTAAMLVPLARGPAAAPTGQPHAIAVEGESGERLDAMAVRIADTVDWLASDALEGRYAGSEGGRRAAEGLASRLDAIDGVEPAGVDGSWFQPFTVAGLSHEARCRNVAGRLLGRRTKGSEPSTIVLGAHYDHRGRTDTDDEDPVFNGADDNASGCAAVLEIAGLLAAGDRPESDILFVFFDAEEVGVGLGINGSDHYISAPLAPLDETALMINFDMVGRLTGGLLMVGGTGTSAALPNFVAEASTGTGLRIHELATGIAGSDNLPFFEARIPVLFVFTGFHRDYHEPTDEAGLVNVHGIARVADFAARLVRAVDRRRHDLPFAADTEEMDVKPDWSPRLRLGVTFEKALWFRIPAKVSDVEEGSPAGAAGLRVGDVVVEIDGVPTPDHQTTERLLRLDDLSPTEREAFTPRPMTLRVHRDGCRDGIEHEPDTACDTVLRCTPELR